jgi:hypothetical protein
LLKFFQCPLVLAANGDHIVFNNFASHLCFLCLWIDLNKVSCLTL